MAITVYKPNHAKYMISTGGVVLSTDTIKAVLLDTSFTPNIDTHATLSDITANQLSTEYGYTQNNKTVTNQAVTENDTTDKAEWDCDDVTWTASGGDIGPFQYLAFYSDTSSDDTVLAIIDYGVSYTITDGASFTAKDNQITIG